MSFRLFGFGALGFAVLASIHGCASDDDATPPTQSSAAASGAGGTNGSAGRGGSAGTDASGGMPDAGGAPSSGGTGGNAADGGTGTAGKSNRGGTGGSRTGSGGSRTGSGGTRASAGGSQNGTGGSALEGGASGEAGAETGGTASASGGMTSSSGGMTASNGGMTASNGGMTAASGGVTSTSGGMTSSSGGATAGGAGRAGAAGAAGQGCVDTVNLPLLTSAPATLDLTGLYTSADSLPTDTASYVEEYTPTYVLWSDGANKKRWIYLPPCTQIDTSDMDHWVFPVGTRFWKEFRIGDTLVETRFIHRFGTGPSDWLFAAYQWDPNVSSPTAGNTIYVPHGVGNANGTPHDIPDQSDCTLCHGHLPEHILGFGAFELTGSPGAIDIGVLSQQNLLTVPAPNGFVPPGTSVQAAGLGYLHANCGMCHSAYFDATPTDPPRMRLLTGETTVATTDTYKTLVKHLTQNADFTGVYRIAPGDHGNSEIYQRMSLRPENSATRGYDQMPPVATEDPDSAGMAAVAAFIDSLPPDAPAGQ